MTFPSLSLVKTVAALKQKKFRDQHQAILVEGLHPIEEALKAGLILQHAFICQGKENEESLFPIEPYIVDEATMQRMTTTDSPPSCLAVFERPSWSHSNPLSQPQNNLILILDGIQDPGNLGTITRSAIAFGISGIILTEDSVEFYSPKVIRASAGLIFAIPMTVQNRISILKDLNGWTVYGTFGRDHPNSRHYQEMDYRGACVIILGNEAHGISPELKECSQLKPITIPMVERVESLNVAISGSIILSQAAAQRGVIVV